MRTSAVFETPHCLNFIATLKTHASTRGDGDFSSGPLGSMIDGDALADQKDGEQNSALAKIHRWTLFVLPHAWQGRPIFSSGEEAIKPWHLCMFGTRCLGSIPYAAFVFLLLCPSGTCCMVTNFGKPGHSQNSVGRVRVSRANATEPVSLGPPCNLLHTFYIFLDPTGSPGYPWFLAHPPAERCGRPGLSSVSVQCVYRTATILTNGSPALPPLYFI